ncbi:hypothetical protein [Burkholderia singularis]|uniref:Uncharacterized protein n=1 Tax=Burkholderia singularis TaxID=1503053 RepID=A0A238HBW7_9BURK|nr:hypothetical protein [Burkholderia singularis]SMG02477.1 hypothetical protein BSIN_5127 [Burkholderia singularis]
MKADRTADGNAVQQQGEPHQRACEGGEARGRAPCRPRARVADDAHVGVGAGSSPDIWATVCRTLAPFAVALLIALGLYALLHWLVS